MDISRNIKLLCSIKGLPLKDLANVIDMTETGFHKALNRNDFKVSTLKKVAKALDVSVADLLLSSEELAVRFHEITPRDILEMSAKIKRLEKAISELQV